MGLALPIELTEEAPKLVTIYCVQLFWKDGRKLNRGSLKEFKSKRDAIAAGRAAVPRNAGAVVFSVEGNPEADYWRDPRWIATHGEVPPLEAY